MRPIHWKNEKEFSLGPISFLCAAGDYALRTDEQRVVLLKNRGSLADYAKVLPSVSPRNVLEFGIFQGGSPALFSLWLELEKFVGIDISPPIAAFDSLCRRHGLERTICSHYGVSQTDRAAIESIIRSEFGMSPIDLIIDDASHLYRHSKRTFEIAFPFLKPGGCYVIEDWGWAHWPDSPYLKGETALSLLIMELIMLSATRADIIEEIRVFPSFAFVIKSPNAPVLNDMKLDRLYTKRGLGLIGPKDLRFSDLWSVLLSRIRGR